MNEDLPSVLLVGCGNMGGALWAGWASAGIAPSVILDRHCPAPDAPHRIARVPAEIPADFRPDFVVLAVKPGVADKAIASVAPWLGGATILSVMAGRQCSGLAAAATAPGADPALVPVIRSMPNMPSAIGKGMTGVFAGPAVSARARARATALLEAVGAVAWVEDEGQIDLVTAISGSGPAYVYLLAELMEQAGIGSGLPAPVARKLARATVAGSGAILEASDLDSAILRRNVTSPGGTTAAALDVLMAPGNWPEAIGLAIDAAARRARELAR